MHYNALPIADIPQSTCARLRGIFFDIDDTFTYRGRIHPEAFDALWLAKRRGLILVPVTGRPAGWADHIARMWPVDGVIGENGALYFAFDEKRGRLVKRYTIEDAGQRKLLQARLYEIFYELKSLVPGAELASDQAYRETDLAVDFCEDVHPPLSLEEAQRIKHHFESHGASAKISSIHVNAWFGTYDKLTMCKRFLEEQKGMRLDDHEEEFLFCGDSPNDAPLFRYFTHACGVAGIERFNDASLIDSYPRYVATGEGSYGFAEILHRVLGKRGDEANP